jgi:GMP synthase-like glutamine amidotransferase
MKIHCIQHDLDCPPGSVLLWAQQNNHTLDVTKTYQNEKFPSLVDFDWLVILGGAMNVYEDDKYLWLKEEKEFIKNAILSGKTTIGFCLGGQLLAVVLGGKVTQNKRLEFGWHNVSFNDKAGKHKILSAFSKDEIIFQWHKDTFSRLPKGADLIAESKACKHQGFIYNNNVFAFQFHLETTKEIIDDFVNASAKLNLTGEYVQSNREILAGQNYIEKNKALMFKFLSALEMETL